MKNFKPTLKWISVLALASASSGIFAESKSQGQNNGQPFKAIQAQIDSNLALIQANQNDIIDLKSQTVLLLESFNELDSQLGGLEQRVSSNEADLISVNIELDAVDGSLSDLFSEVSQVAARHNADMLDIQQQIDTLSSAVISNTEELNTLNLALVAKAQELSTAISENAIAVDSLAADLALLNAQANMLSLSLVTAQQALSSLEVRASSHETEITALLLRVSTVEADVANHTHDEIDLTGVELSYESEGRDVHIFKTPQAAILADHTEFCATRGLTWWAPKSSADAQLMLDNARAIDDYHTWVQVYGLVTTTGNPATLNGFPIAPDGPSCVAGSNSGWAGVRDWACSLCDPDGSSGVGSNGLSYCWDTNHQYDWFACEAN